MNLNANTYKTPLKLDEKSQRLVNKGPKQGLEIENVNDCGDCTSLLLHKCKQFEFENLFCSME